jgi:hypothetical protein
VRVEALEPRVALSSASGNAWPSPSVITLSFMPDGTDLGGVPSNLFATFNKNPRLAGQWQTQILKAAQAWAQATNLNFVVVPDDGEPSGAGPDQQGDPGFGDIRIGGYNFGNSTLARAFLPPPVNNFSIAGDIEFNTGQGFSIGATYDLFSVATHEIGHALGLYHSGIASAVMYASYNGAKAGLSSDDVQGIEGIYSGGKPRGMDRFESGGATNNGFATATDITSRIDPTTRTGVVTGLDISSTTDSDVFLLSGTAPSSTGRMTLTVQSQGLSLLAPAVTVYAADQTTVVASASGAGQYGTTLTVSWSGVGQGKPFYIKVTGADTSAFGTGSYALTLNGGNNPTPAVPTPNTTLAEGSPLQAGGGQAVKVNDETLVNTQTSGVQTLAPNNQRSVAIDARGNHVVTWASQNQDGSGWGVYAQRFDADGNPLGGEFRVNTTTSGDQTGPNVAMNQGGSFVIAWSSSGQDWSGWGIYAQRYDAAGNPLGGEFRVNTTTLGDQINPSVAIDDNGDFVVAWQSRNQDGSGWGIYTQSFDAHGLPLGLETRANTTTAGDQTNPSVAMDRRGDLVIAWQSAGQDGSGLGVYARKYTALTGVLGSLLGGVLGGEFLVNTTTAGDQASPSVAMNDSGDFAITWSSYGQDGQGWGVYAQRYDAQGLPLGGEFRASTTTAGDQRYSSVAMDDSGDLLITWETNGNGSQGNWLVYGQQYVSGGTPLGGEFMVNTTTGYDENNASVAMNDLGDVVSAWSGYGPADPDGVFLQQFSISFSGLDGGASSDDFFAEGDPNDPDQTQGPPAVTMPATAIATATVTATAATATAATDDMGHGPAGIPASAATIDQILGTTPDLLFGATRSKHRRGHARTSLPNSLAHATMHGGV